MSLTNRILLAMVVGILLGSLLNLMLQTTVLSEGLRVFTTDVLIDGVFDVVGRIFVASLKLLVVPLVLVSLICAMAMRTLRYRLSTPLESPTRTRPRSMPISVSPISN